MISERTPIKVSDIHVPDDYLRPVDETAVKALAHLIENEGQKSPIAVHSSNRSSSGKPYTLVYGARRLKAHELLGLEMIDVVLRKKKDALILAIQDNLSATALDALEQAEHLVAFRQLWEKQFGAATAGGDRKSNGQRGRLIEDLNLSEKPNLFKDITSKFQISERTARRFFHIGWMPKELRDVLRGTPTANDRTYLVKLSRLERGEQVKMASVFRIKHDPKLIYSLVRPQAGRTAAGRMDTQDWRETQFTDGWNGMSQERRATALEKLGLMQKPIDPWPTHLKPIEPLLPSPAHSPLAAMLRDPYRQLSKYFDFEELKMELAWEEEYAALKRQSYIDAINSVEKERREQYQASKIKAKKIRAPKTKRGRPPDTPAIKLEKKRAKLIKQLMADAVSEELADRLVNTLEADETFWIFQEAPKLTNEQQQEVLLWIDHGDRLEDAAYRVMKMLEPSKPPEHNKKELSDDLHRNEDHSHRL